MGTKLNFKNLVQPSYLAAVLVAAGGPSAPPAAVISQRQQGARARAIGRTAAGCALRLARAASDPVQPGIPLARGSALAAARKKTVATLVFRPRA